MKLPKITIITVVYNAKEDLITTMNNVFSLKYGNLSYFVIDGGSQDGTLTVIEENSSRIDYWISEPDKGIYDAMNKGWLRAEEHSYILFLGAGDKVINLPKTELLSYENKIIYGDVIIGQNNLFKSSLGWRSYLGNTIHHQALLIMKFIHIIPPFNLNFKTYADFDFNQILIKSGEKFVKDIGFLSCALEGGVSSKIDYDECHKIVVKNYGNLIGCLALIYYKIQKRNERRKINSCNSSL